MQTLSYHAVLGAILNQAQSSTLIQVIIGTIASIVAALIIWIYRKKVLIGLTWLISVRKASSVCKCKDYNTYFQSLQSALQNSNKLDILVLMGIDFTNNKLIPGRGVNSLLGQLLTHNDDLQVRVLVMNPDSSHVLERAKKINRSVSHVRNGIISSLNDLMDIQKKHDAIEIRMYDVEPIWRLVNTDIGIYVGFYQSRRSYDNQFYFIPNKQDSLYESFVRYFDIVWNDPETQHVRNNGHYQGR